MDRQTLHRLYSALAELETIEKIISEWQQIVIDPDTRFGLREGGASTESSRFLSVVIQARYQEDGPNRDKPELVSELWTEASIKKAVELFIEDLRERATDLRMLLSEHDVDPNTAVSGAVHSGFEDHSSALSSK